MRPGYMKGSGGGGASNFARFEHQYSDEWGQITLDHAEQ